MNTLREQFLLLKPVFKKAINLWCKLVSLSVVISCSGEHNGGEITGESFRQKKLKEVLLKPTNISFSDVKSYVLDSACLSCHDATKKAGGVDMSSYESLVESDQVDAVIPTLPEESPLYQTLDIKRGSRQMPPQGNDQLNTEQKDLIYHWIKNGAKKIASGTEQVVTLGQRLQYYFDNPEAIDYAVVKEYVFNPGQCIKCHSAESESAQSKAIVFGADLSSYDKLGYLGGIVAGYPVDVVKMNVDEVTYIQPGSNIYKSVAITQSMPPAGEGYEPLNALRIKLLRLWILNCAIEDSDSEESKLNLLSEYGPNGKVRNCK